MSPLVIDPLAGRGDTFRVSFQVAGPTSLWQLTNISTGSVVVAGQTNLSGDGAYPIVDGYYWPASISNMPGGATNTKDNGPREWLFVLNSPYTGPAPEVNWQDVLTDTTIPVMYTFTWNRRYTTAWHPPLEVEFTPVQAPATDTYEFVIPGPHRTQAEIDAGIGRLGVYPNPYLAERTQVSSALDQSVTFTNLPQRATVRIFNLAGHLVRTLYEDSPSQFFNWNLLNESGWVVASGMYICYVELPDLGRSKVLKLGVVIGERIPGGF